MDAARLDDGVENVGKNKYSDSQNIVSLKNQ